MTLREDAAAFRSRRWWDAGDVLSGLSRRLAPSEDVEGNRSKPLVHRQLRRVRRLVGAVKFGPQITASDELTRAHAYDRLLDHMISPAHFQATDTLRARV